MPHIQLTTDAPGIVGLFDFRPATAKPLRELAEVLLRGPSTLTPGERELIAATVSNLNECTFCTASHGAFAAAQLPNGMSAVEAVMRDANDTSISVKLSALLSIATLVQRSGTAVTADCIATAREAGATDVEIHDTVLIAAAFCMYNRYVDGLGTLTPEDQAVYARMAERIVATGYQEVEPIQG